MVAALAAAREVSEMARTVLKVDGMSCQGCVKNVTGVLQALPGVTATQVSLEKAEAVIDFDEAKLSRDELKRAVDDAGFDAS